MKPQWRVRSAGGQGSMADESKPLVEITHTLMAEGTDRRLYQDGGKDEPRQQPVDEYRKGGSRTARS